MNIHNGLVSLITIFSLLCPALHAQTSYTGPENSGFENVAEGQLPAGWSADSRNIKTDTDVKHSGNNSMRIFHPDYFSSKVYSSKIKLTVGNLYCLSAWIKTDNASTNQYNQYPTPVAACLSMESFPFTNHSAVLGGTSDWEKIEMLFIATQSEDRICLNLGYNGGAKGCAWFDDVTLEETEDISDYIPMETVKWHGNSFRFEDKGWTFIHIEGNPYKRGFDYGFLLAADIRDFILKLANNRNSANSQFAWNETRFAADALMLRKYDAEYLEEMKGIAEGVNKAGIKLFDRPLDLVDITALNSAVDISYCGDAVRVTPNPMTGRSFLSAEDELTLSERLHKCSGFLATNAATENKRIVFGQLFMWNGYTGNDWRIITDVVPEKGHRLVYETFPGGIHSGADFYINDAGIMIGETTVNQGPFNQDGIPQSSRIRKAAQYSENIDDVTRILTEKNNGLYTNDWLIGDTKNDEIAILVLGTNKFKLWRSSKNDFNGGQKDWYWSDNNNKSEEVRKEYITNDNNAPYDITFRPVNRDISFTSFYDTAFGKINAVSGINLLATSPVNRPHACDGKLTTSEMAEHMMFFAHYGKVTQREKFVNENGRIPDLPGASPHLSLGYSVISPVLFTKKLIEMKSKKYPQIDELQSLNNIFAGNAGGDLYSFDKDKLWHNTVYPATDKENWFVSSTAAYWNMLNSLPDAKEKAAVYLSNEFAELNNRLLYTESREGTIKPVDAATSYTHYKYYQIPRIKGTYLLHQLRLFLGNDVFSKAMNSLHNEYKEKNITNEKILNAFEKTSGKSLQDLFTQWLERHDLPEYKLTSTIHPNGDSWDVIVNIEQIGHPYNYMTELTIETGRESIRQIVEISKTNNIFTFPINDKPRTLIFNSGNDIPTEHENFYTYSNFSDEFDSSLIVYGTCRQDEACHTMALRYQKMAADRFTETLLPLKKDSEIDLIELSKKDLVILGGTEDNLLMKEIVEKLGIKTGKNYFEWNNRVYGNSDDGLFAAYPNPYNPMKTVYLFISNSAKQMYEMTKTLNRMPSWAIFNKDQIRDKGYFTPAGNRIDFQQ